MIEKLLVDKNTTLEKTIKIMDDGGLGIAFVTDKNKFVGLVEDSDIRRALLKGVNLSQPIISITNKTPVTVGKNWDNKEVNAILLNDDIKEMFPNYGTIKIPVIDKGKVIDIIFLSQKGYEGRLNAGFEAKKVKRVLVVGGAGYLGSVLCKKLLDKGYSVRVLDNLTYGNDGIKNIYGHPNFEFVFGDMRNIQTVVNATKDVDAVIHLAAIVGDPASALDPQKTVEVNYLSTKLLADICKYSQINRFIFASTCSVYGASKDEKLTETSKTNPVSLYAEMKLKSEEGILKLVDDNFSPTIFRMGTLHGLSPRMRFDLVVNILTAKAFYEHKIDIFGGEQWRPLINVGDAADAYIKCLETPINKVKGEVFNIGADNFKIKDIGEAVGTIIPETKVNVDSSGDIRNYNVSFDKAGKVIKHKILAGLVFDIMRMKEEMDKGKFRDYKDKKYSNYAYLKGEE